MLAIEKIILLVIFLIVLVVVFFLLFVVGKGSADTLLLQNELRQCCGLFRASDCSDTSISCDGKTIQDIALELGMDTTSNDQLKSFCSCPT